MQTRLLLLCYMSLSLLLSSCQAPSSQSHQAAEPVSFELPDEVKFYGGLDYIQAWLVHTQKYAQTAYPKAPVFTMMLPILLAQQLGLKHPNEIDLIRGMRWFAIPKKPNSSLADKPIIDRWDSMILLPIKDAQKTKTTLSKKLWQVANNQDDVFTSKIPDQPGFLYLRDRYLILCSQAIWCEKYHQDLITYAETETLPALTLAMRPSSLPLEQWMQKLQAQEASIDQQDMMQVLNHMRSADAFQIALQVKSDQLAIELQMKLGDDSSVQQELASYTHDATDALQRIPDHARGVLMFYPKIFASLWKLLQNKKDLQKDLQKHVNHQVQLDLQPLLQQIQQQAIGQYASHLTSIFVDPQLQLSALLAGKSSTLQPLVHQFLKYCKAQFESGAWDTSRVRSQAQATPLQLKLSQAKMLKDYTTESLTVLNPPTTKNAQTSPQLQDLSVQLSELRTLYTPDFTWFAFGPKSRDILKDLHQRFQIHQGQKSLMSHDGLSDLHNAFKRLVFFFYITPNVIGKATQKFLNVTPIGQKRSKNGQEQPVATGLSLMLAAHDAQRYFIRLTVPVEVAEQISTSIHLFKALISNPQSK